LMPGKERWDQIKDLFEAAADLPITERDALLRTRCGDDSALRREVEVLLASDAADDEFISTPAFDVRGVFGDEEDVAQIGRQYGAYRILREIGRGGLGAVYLAERADAAFEKQVAIKLIRRGLDTEDILRRFRNERQILAQLDHPNIARLLDGGTTEEGLPYFVMEYVEGVPMTTYCEERQMPIRDRLKLFRTICAAVAYAHQHLVIHRDLKPSNILVTTAGEPKLLDFGIAKLLHAEPEAAALTIPGLRAMTPEYASPEQIRGQPVTTGSDVYSLGVIFYELLTGRSPYQLKTQEPAELERAITDTDPAKPSTVLRERILDTPPSEARPIPGEARALRGDLDNIALMAMRKEPARRYASVGEFSGDIRRHLDGLPVHARTDTLRYRGTKFVQRHRLAVAAAVVVLVSLLAGLIATAWQARRADRERVLAEERFDQVRRLAHSLMYEIHDSVANLAGSTPTRRLIVSRALEYLDTLSRGARQNPELQREVATAYEKIGDIQGNPYSANLGDTDDALKSYRKALALRTALPDAEKSVDLQMELGRSYRGLGDILEQKGDVAGCIANYQRSLGIFAQMAALHGADFAVQDELARAYDTMGDGLGRTNRSAERSDCYRKELSIRENLLATHSHDRKQRRATALALMKTAMASDAHDSTAAENARRGAKMMEALSADDSQDARARREVGWAYYSLGGILLAAGDYPGTLEARQKALAVRQATAAEDPKNAQATFDLAVSYADLAEALTRNGRAEEAIGHAQHSLQLLQQLTTADPSNAVYLRNLALSYEKFGEAYSSLGRAPERSTAERLGAWNNAQPWYQKAADVFLELRRHGTLMPTDNKEPERFAGKVKECQDWAAKLKPEVGG
ncbi:MAG: serine/threonine-protein kinase, partial [Verrucomicrobiota bacterium]